jgi:hypothetical protein
VIGEAETDAAVRALRSGMVVPGSFSSAAGANAVRLAFESRGLVGACRKSGKQFRNIAGATLGVPL